MTSEFDILRYETYFQLLPKDILTYLQPYLTIQSYSYSKSYKLPNNADHPKRIYSMNNNIYVLANYNLYQLGEEPIPINVCENVIDFGIYDKYIITLTYTGLGIYTLSNNMLTHIRNFDLTDHCFSKDRDSYWATVPNCLIINQAGYITIIDDTSMSYIYHLRDNCIINKVTQSAISLFVHNPCGHISIMNNNQLVIIHNSDNSKLCYRNIDIISIDRTNPDNWVYNYTISKIQGLCVIFTSQRVHLCSVMSSYQPMMSYATLSYWNNDTSYLRLFMHDHDTMSRYVIKCDHDAIRSIHIDTYMNLIIGYDHGQIDIYKATYFS